MNVDGKIMVNKENLQKMQAKLRALKLMIQDKDVQSTIGEMLELLDSELKPRNSSLGKKIKKKMNETKYSNPEVHFKLYMLYRKLAGGEIDEEEAMKAYEVYVLS